MAKAIAVEDHQHEQGLNKMKGQYERFSVFLGDVRDETKKLNTPTSAEVRATTTVVLVTVFIFAAYFAVVDYAVSHTIGALLEKLTRH